MTDDEKFFAWLDGELGPQEAADMDAKVADDPALAKLAEQHRSLRRDLGRAFNPVSEAPVPPALDALLHRQSNIVDFAAVKRQRVIPSFTQWGAIAASLAVGIYVGTMVPQQSQGPVEMNGGALYAAASLNRALDSKLASAPTNDIHIGITFRNQAGSICRSFTGSGSSGLACRSGGHWQIKGLFGEPEGQSSDYRMAGGMDPNLAALVNSTMAGEPLDSAQERAAQKSGWKSLDAKIIR